jgi:succinyl-CoA synthetase alpha subunit
VSILVDERTTLVVQGITGNEGTFHTLRNRDYGTKVVAGVTPGKGGQDVEGIPVYDTVARAVAETGADTSMIFVPPRFAAEAILEAVDAGIGLVVCITEGIPVGDMAKVHSYLEASVTRLVGPNCPGVISPGATNVGIIPGEICAPGAVGLVSRSGTLVYQIVHELTQRGIGQSTCVGMGGDPVHGIGFVEAVELFQSDAETELIVLTGEIGGDDEERAAAFIAERVTKPVVGYIAGFEAPPGKRMGHAGAIVTGSSGTATAKAEALEAVGVAVGRNPSQVADLVAERLGRACRRPRAPARGSPTRRGPPAGPRSAARLPSRRSSLSGSCSAWWGSSWSGDTGFGRGRRSASSPRCFPSGPTSLGRRAARPSSAGRTCRSASTSASFRWC